MGRWVGRGGGGGIRQLTRPSESGGAGMLTVKAVFGVSFNNRQGPVSVMHTGAESLLARRAVCLCFPVVSLITHSKGIPPFCPAALAVSVCSVYLGFRDRVHGDMRSLTLSHTVAFSHLEETWNSSGMSVVGEG